jgi:hypothetical protein
MTPQITSIHPARPLANDPSEITREVRSAGRAGRGGDRQPGDRPTDGAAARLAGLLGGLHRAEADGRPVTRARTGGRLPIRA